MGTPTPKLSLARPDAGDTDWADEINDNWTTLDDAYVAGQEIECNGLKVPYDNVKIQLGAGDDAGMWYDGTHLHINPYQVGGGNLAIGNIAAPLATVHVEDASAGTTIYAKSNSGYAAGLAAERPDSGAWIRLHSGGGNTASLVFEPGCDFSIFESTPNTAYADNYSANLVYLTCSGAADKIIMHTTVRFEGSIKFGAAESVTIYHGTNYLTLAAGDQFRFRDSASYITSDAVGHLDLTADTSVDVNALLDISAQDIKTDTSTGTKIGTATNEKLGFFNATPVDQPATVSDATTQDLTGSDSVDQTKLEADLTSCKDAINAVIDRLQELGLMASS